MSDESAQADRVNARTVPTMMPVNLGRPTEHHPATSRRFLSTFDVTDSGEVPSYNPLGG
jgi:hypothetical protein